MANWWQPNRDLRESDRTPVTMGRVITEVRNVLPPEGIVFTSAGNIQAQVFQEMAFTRPRTYLSAGGFSTMGWAFPAALGAKLAAPDVAGRGHGRRWRFPDDLPGTGDGRAVQYPGGGGRSEQPGLAGHPRPANHRLWRGSALRRHVREGRQPVHTAHRRRCAGLWRARGRITRPDEVAPALKEALALQRPAVIEVMVDTTLGTSGGLAPGWWDVPVPGYYEKRRALYDQERREEQI